MRRIGSGCFFLALVALVAWGCGDDEPSWTIEDQPLQGSINGQPWTYSSGQASPGFEDDEFSIDIYTGAPDPCAGFGDPDDAEDRKILASIPDTPGEYDLGWGEDSHTITFFYSTEEHPAMNVIATEGKLVIDEITDQTISGGLAAQYDSDNKANGRFELTRCANIDQQ
jgi:hypothetical protein